MLWLDGTALPDGCRLDRGLEFGDGLFETIAVVAGRPRLLERHLARLAAGCARLGIAAPPSDAVAAELARAAATPGTGVVKLILTRGEGGRGYAADAAAAPRRWLAALPARPRPAALARDGIAVRPLATRLAEQPLLAGLKHLNRLEQVLGRRELAAGPAAEEGLMLDVQGRLVCGTMTNVFAVIDSRLTTPALERAGVAGVVRGALIDAWRAAGTAVDVRDVDPAELDRASEVFVTNALVGVWPVARLGARALGPGPRAREAQAWVAEW
jgi:4-amino-4-deoxychorismate lyase